MGPRSSGRYSLKEPAEGGISSYLANWVVGCPRQLADDEVIVFRVGKIGTVSGVSEREFRDLTSKEIADNRHEVQVAEFKELK